MPIKELLINLEPEGQRPDVRAKRNVLNKVLQGNWNTMQKGEGMEFAGFRQYTYEDDASRIDWKASLRSDSLLVREFEEYRNINVFVLLDVSNTMLFTSREKLKAEYGAEIAYSLCDSILKAGDAVGLGMFTDELLVNIPPNIGTGSHYRIRNSLLDPNNYGGHSSLKEVLKFVSSTLKERYLVIIISDFIGLEEGWEKYIDLMASEMDIIGIMLRDPRDKAFPTSGGQFTLNDPSTEESIIVDTKHSAKIFREFVEKEEAKIKRVFERANSSFLSLNTGQELYDPLLSFFYKRRSILER